MGKASAGVGEIWDGRYRTVSELASMYLPSEAPEAQALVTAYGRAMMAWNMTEMILGQLLEELISEEKGAGRATILALTSDLNGVALETAIASLAPHVCAEDRLPDILYILDLTSRIRGYRNYYAHSLSYVVVEKTRAVAPILKWTAKPKIRQSRDQISKAQLDQFATWCAETSAFIKCVIEDWYPLSLDGKTPPPPERPSLPPRCTKTANYLQAQPRLLPPRPEAR